MKKSKLKQLVKQVIAQENLSAYPKQMIYITNALEGMGYVIKAVEQFTPNSEGTIYLSREITRDMDEEWDGEDEVNDEAKDVIAAVGSRFSHDYYGGDSYDDSNEIGVSFCQKKTEVCVGVYLSAHKDEMDAEVSFIEQ